MTLDKLEDMGLKIKIAESEETLRGGVCEKKQKVDEETKRLRACLDKQFP